MGSASAVGPFELEERIGEGGMGAVWRARHRPSGAHVAVKTGLEMEPGPAAAARFRREVQAIAGLDHPRVVAVLDAGTDPAWLAMELVAGGSLASDPPTDWASIRQVLLQLLEGLAVAHARGITHRDLKPANVLRGDDGWKLADFGIAHGDGDGDAWHGSLSHMAPEQLRGDWRSFGPWTDLYALGCTAWWLLCGETPFTGDPDEVVYGHTSLDPGPLPAGTPAPIGFEGWLGRCLAKRPHERFQSAAEASRALRAIEGESVDAGLPEAPPVLHGPARPPLEGTGLGLYALRSRRLVGRERVQRDLWQAARRQAERGTTEIALLRGPSGSGKSALAAWLSEAVHAAGGSALLGVHDPRSPVDALAEALIRALGFRGLGRTELAAHLAAWGRARAIDALALGRLLSRLSPAGAEADQTALPRAALATAEARHQAVSDAMAWLAGGRPQVVWLDDLQWGAGTLEWLAWQAGRPGPLVVATVQDEALVDAGLEEGIAALEATSHAVGSLAPEAWPALVRELLGLTGELAQRVEERTRGNPLFATQLVGDWVERGILTASGGGFALRDGEAVPLPASLAQTWTNRVDRLLDGVPVEGVEAFALAAMLGESIDPALWEAACAHAGAQSDRAPLTRAAAASLLRERDGSWVFVHGMFQEAVVQRVPEPRGGPLHRACAAALASQQENLEHAERIARHRLAAGQGYEALEPLWQGALIRQRALDFRGAFALLDEREHRMEHLGVADTDSAWAEGWVQRGRVHSSLGDTSTGQVFLAKGVAWAQLHGWNRWLVQAGLLSASNLGLAGHPDRARELLDELEPHLSSAHERAMHAGAKATTDIYQRRYDEALVALHGALALDGVSAHQRCDLWLRVISAHAFCGNTAEAERAYRETVALTEQTGETINRANAEESMGVLHHVAGRYARALEHYRTGLEKVEEIGGSSPNLELNVCLVLAHTGALDEASARLVPVKRAIREDDVARRSYIVGIEVRIAAAGADSGVLEVQIERWEALLAASSLVDTDIALFAEDAAADARTRGWADSAARLEAIGRAQRAAIAG